MWLLFRRKRENRKPLRGNLTDITMDRYTETFETWNKLATLFEDQFMDLDLYHATYDVFCSLMTKPKLLEIGCGPGNITKYLLSKRPDFNVFGIDVAPNMIELAIKNNPTAGFAIMDCRQISGLESKFDGIVCGFCLPYLSHSDCEKFMADCSLLLNDNGHLYLSFVEGDPGRSGFQIGSGGDRVYFYYYKLDWLTDQLLKNKFNQIQVFTVQYQRAEGKTEMHTILIAQKKTGA